MGTRILLLDYAEYRWMPSAYFHTVPFVFGNSLAFLIFGAETTVHVIHNAEIAAAQRTQFHLPEGKEGAPC